MILPGHRGRGKFINIKSVTSHMNKVCEGTMIISIPLFHNILQTSVWLPFIQDSPTYFTCYLKFFSDLSFFCFHQSHHHTASFDKILKMFKCTWLTCLTIKMKLPVPAVPAPGDLLVCDSSNAWKNQSTERSDLFQICHIYTTMK